MKRLNHKEEEVMQILWHLKQGFVKEILDKMSAPKPPYNTVSSIVRKLETMKLVGHEAFGKTHRYFPILKKENYRKQSFQAFMSNYFGGSPSQLLSYFVEEQELSSSEISQLLNELKEKS
jgi:predicted transcriptional regulator